MAAAGGAATSPLEPTEPYGMSAGAVQEQAAVYLYCDTLSVNFYYDDCENWPGGFGLDLGAFIVTSYELFVFYFNNLGLFSLCISHR